MVPNYYFIIFLNPFDLINEKEILEGESSFMGYIPCIISLCIKSNSILIREQYIFFFCCLCMQQKLILYYTSYYIISKFVVDNTSRFETPIDLKW